jgi:hypothetical protein
MKRKELRTANKKRRKERLHPSPKSAKVAARRRRKARQAKRKTHPNR